MYMKFSKHVQIQPSATMAMNALAQKKELKGQHVYNLTAGEVEIETDIRISNAAKHALDRGETNYVSAAGIIELRTAVTNWYNEQYKTDFKSENAIVTCGGKSALQMLSHAFLEEGDEALIIAPFWVSYSSMVKLFGAVPKLIHTEYEQNWKVDLKKLEEAITEKTKVLFLNNGSNPTGVLYSREELKAILQIAQGHNIIVISDEVYSGLVYDNNEYVSCSEFDEYKENVVIVQSASKNFAMTGWRVGFVIGNTELIKKLTTIQSHSSSGTSSISQWAAVSALQHSKEITERIQTTLQKRRDVFIETFNRLFPEELKKPQCAFYNFIPISAFGVSETDSVAFCSRILEHGNVAMVPGVAFGMEGYVRCSFGIKEEKIIQALETLSSYLRL